MEEDFDDWFHTQKYCEDPYSYQMIRAAWDHQEETILLYEKKLGELRLENENLKKEQN